MGGHVSEEREVRPYNIPNAYVNAFNCTHYVSWTKPVEIGDAQTSAEKFFKNLDGEKTVTFAATGIKGDMVNPTTQTRLALGGGKYSQSLLTPFVTEDSDIISIAALLFSRYGVTPELAERLTSDRFGRRSATRFRDDGFLLFLPGLERPG